MERNELEGYLKRLQKLDEDLSEDSDINNEFMQELNNIIAGMTQGVQTEAVKTTGMVDLKYINLSSNPDLNFEHEGDSGFDLRAFLNRDVRINEGGIRVIPTGLYFEVEKGLEVQVRSRNGMAENGMFAVNSPGTIDSCFRGEVQVILANLSDIPRTIRNGDRIAQGVVCPVFGEGRLNLIKTEKLSETIRNKNGLGSTGIE